MAEREINGEHCPKAVLSSQAQASFSSVKQECHGLYRDVETRLLMSGSIRSMDISAVVNDLPER